MLLFSFLILLLRWTTTECANVTDDHIYYILMEHNTSDPNYYDGLAFLSLRLLLKNQEGLATYILTVSTKLPS